MSLLDTFRSLPTARRSLGTLPRWMSGLRSQLPSRSVSSRSPELLPAAVAVLLLITAGLQVAMPSSSSLPETRPSAPRAAAEPAAPVTQTYAAVLQRPIFAPDRAPIVLQAAATGNLNGIEVLGTAIAGSVSAALVRDNTGRIMRVKPDAILQGWRLVSIDRAQLLFDRDGERRTIAVAAAPARSGVNPQLATSASKSSDDDDDDSSSSNSSSNNSNDDDDDDDN
jgi:hypothetical protein